MEIPQHIAIILDGNGRWAQSRGLPRNEGHIAGAKNVEAMYDCLAEMGIKYFTVYAFSTENWNRPADEVSALMKLLRSYMSTSIKRANKQNMRVRILGDKTRLDQDLQDAIAALEEATAGNTGLNYQMAINYGGRDEIVRATKKISRDIVDGKLSPEDVTEKLFGSYLDSADIPDPDLVIRTCGEQRISNFLLWQSAYTEYYFCDCAWPDFNKAELEKAIEAYNRRDRKYGGLKK